MANLDGNYEVFKMEIGLKNTLIIVKRQFNVISYEEEQSKDCYFFLAILQNEIILDNNFSEKNH